MFLSCCCSAGHPEGVVPLSLPRSRGIPACPDLGIVVEDSEVPRPHACPQGFSFPKIIQMRKPVSTGMCSALKGRLGTGAAKPLPGAGNQEGCLEEVAFPQRPEAAGGSYEKLERGRQQKYPPDRRARPPQAQMASGAGAPSARRVRARGQLGRLPCRRWLGGGAAAGGAWLGGGAGAGPEVHVEKATLVPGREETEGATAVEKAGAPQGDEEGVCVCGSADTWKARDGQGPVLCGTCGRKGCLGEAYGQDAGGIWRDPWFPVGAGGG